MLTLYSLDSLASPVAFDSARLGFSLRPALSSRFWHLSSLACGRSPPFVARGFCLSLCQHHSICYGVGFHSFFCGLLRGPIIFDWWSDVCVRCVLSIVQKKWGIHQLYSICGADARFGSVSQMDGFCLVVLCARLRMSGCFVSDISGSFWVCVCFGPCLSFCFQLE